jgi:hypothetical protein
MEMTKVAGNEMTVRQFLEEGYRPTSESRPDLIQHGENPLMPIATTRQHRLEMQVLIAGIVVIVVAVTLGNLFLRAIEAKQCERNPIICQM